MFGIVFFQLFLILSVSQKTPILQNFQFGKMSQFFSDLAPRSLALCIKDLRVLLVEGSLQMFVTTLLSQRWVSSSRTSCTWYPLRAWCYEHFLITWTALWFKCAILTDWHRIKFTFELGWLKSFNTSAGLVEPYLNRYGHTHAELSGIGSWDKETKLWLTYRELCVPFLISSPLYSTDAHCLVQI